MENKTTRKQRFHAIKGLSNVAASLSICTASSMAFCDSQQIDIDLKDIRMRSEQLCGFQNTSRIGELFASNKKNQSLILRCVNDTVLKITYFELDAGYWNSILDDSRFRANAKNIEVTSININSYGFKFSNPMSQQRFGKLQAIEFQRPQLYTLDGYITSGPKKNGDQK